MASHAFTASVLFLFGCSAAVASEAPACPALTYEHMAVEGNAAIVTLALKRTDGTVRPARFIFDSGGGAMILDQTLANDLGLKPTGGPITDGGMQFLPTVPPVAQFGSTILKLDSSKAFIHMGQSSFDTRERVEGLLPGKALEPYQVVLDYPMNRFAVVPEGCIPHRGQPVPSPYLPASGHPSISVTVAGQDHSMLLDTGARTSLARRDFLEELSAANPSWPHATGASGDADMPDGSGQEFLLRVPEVILGSFHIRNVLFVSRPDATYSTDHYETPGPINGALGGNVLRRFRIEIDYPHGTTYLEQSSSDAGGDMRSAGLVLDVENGKLLVRAISTTAAALTKNNVLPGDVILKIGDKRESPWTLIDASDALSGAAGKKVKLVILRGDKVFSTSVLVSDLL